MNSTSLAHRVSRSHATLRRWSLAAVQALARASNLQSDWSDPVEFSLIQIARQQLGEARFEALTAEGQTMTLEQAVGYALENQE